MGTGTGKEEKPQKIEGGETCLNTRNGGSQYSNETTIPARNAMPDQARARRWC